jgi:hypothetical protein
VFSRCCLEFTVTNTLDQRQPLVLRCVREDFATFVPKSDQKSNVHEAHFVLLAILAIPEGQDCH